MKALTAALNIKKEAWDRVKSTILRRSGLTSGITFRLGEEPEPELVSPQWVKVRSIMSGISDMDEGMIVYHDLSSFGPFLELPFVPGNENVGIVVEAGRSVQPIELGQRVVVDPLLACTQRQVDPPCPSCSRGEPHCCRSFNRGVVGPGMMIGACPDTGGGWGDVFIAHHSQIHPLSDTMETETAVLLPELARAVRTVLHNPPSSGDRVIVMGCGSLGLLTVMVLEIFGYDVNVMIVAEHPFEVALARKLTRSTATLADTSGAVYEDVAEFVGGSVSYPRVGSITLHGGADVVYETSGAAHFVEKGLRFAGEGKRFVLSALKQIRALDIGPIWHKAVKILGPGWSNSVLFDGDKVNAFDAAATLMERHPFPVDDLVSHRFPLDQYQQAFATLEDRAAQRAVKVIFHHVV